MSALILSLVLLAAAGAALVLGAREPRPVRVPVRSRRDRS